MLKVKSVDSVRENYTLEKKNVSLFNSLTHTQIDRFTKSIKICLVLTCIKFSNLVVNKKQIEINKIKTILYYKRNKGLNSLCLFVM